ESKSGLYTAKMEQTACIEGVNAGDCSGKRNAIWTITQRDKTEVTASSAMGQLLAGGDFALNAASLDLGNAASLAGGANVTLGAGNLLVNRGRITAAGDLVASAASLNNYGTLGGGGNLRLNAPALLNERGLLFSGADMTLRAGDITNL
ncbi:hypothetical protein, partial [Pseudomonas aeruginosa]